MYQGAAGPVSGCDSDTRHAVCCDLHFSSCVFLLRVANPVIRNSFAAPNMNLSFPFRGVLPCNALQDDVMVKIQLWDRFGNPVLT